MDEIKVRQLSEEDWGWVFSVEVEEGGGSTRHTVTLNKEDFNRMKWDSAEALIQKSFEFLLEREPKESILREFDLMDISRYFPEYESEMGGGK